MQLRYDSEADAIFLWRLERFRQDQQEGVCCAVFRNEGAHLSSDLIQAAQALAWERWPNSRLFTFVDDSKIKSTNPGFCFQKAGWKKEGKTGKGLTVLAINPPAH